MVKAHVLQLLFILDGSHLLSNDEPVEVDIAVLNRVLHLLLPKLLLPLHQLLLRHPVLNQATDLFFDIMQVLELLDRQKLLIILAKLFYLSVKIRHFHIAKLQAFYGLALLSGLFEEVQEV